MTQSKQAARVFLPPQLLRALVSKPGGKSRERAIEDAKTGIESLRSVSIEAIEAAIAAIERAAKAKDTFSNEQLRVISRDADLIVTLAGTFDLPRLNQAARSLCDLAAVLLRAPQCPAEPVAVHARALRLFAPGCRALSEAETRTVMAELEKFRAHFQARTPAADVAE